MVVRYSLNDKRKNYGLSKHKFQAHLALTFRRINEIFPKHNSNSNGKIRIMRRFVDLGEEKNTLRIPRGLKCIALYNLTRFFQGTSNFLRFIGIRSVGISLYFVSLIENGFLFDFQFITKNWDHMFLSMIYYPLKLCSFSF